MISSDFFFPWHLQLALSIRPGLFGPLAAATFPVGFEERSDPVPPSLSLTTQKQKLSSPATFFLGCRILTW